jgi:hypothetical protein
MTRPILIVSALALAQTFMGGELQAHAAMAPAHAAATPAAGDKATGARLAQRDLWDEHIFWVRNVAIATVAKNTPAAAAAEAQVVANARQIADSIAPFYGKPAADQLFALLKGHYGPIKQYLDAADGRARDAARKSLTANAGEIAKFLSGANPHLPYDAVNGLLLAHGAHHLAQIDQLAGGQYKEEGRTWEAMRRHMHDIADALAGALQKQFPDKFA